MLQIRHLFVALAAAATILLPFASALPSPQSELASASYKVTAQAGAIVPKVYIVILKEGTTAEQLHAHRAWATSIHNKRTLEKRYDPSILGIKFVYRVGGMIGYCGSFDSSTIAEIEASEDVAFVEPDRIVTASDIVEQKNTTWNLARICINKAPNPWDYMNYRYDSSGGEGITAYVIDTGINIEHEEFGGRAVFGFNAMGNGEADEDEYGHGTHIAGIIGGTLYGVAKKTNLISVKVLDSNGQGTISTVVAGIQWTVEHAAKNKITRKSVANLSLGSSYSASLNMMVESAIASGITFVVAAGNLNDDASKYSPSSVPSAITVGAMNNIETRSIYSNYGPVVDVFAPGDNIKSAWIGSTTAVHSISGTSMATPHVVGLAAYLMALEGICGSKAVTARIKELAVSGVVKLSGEGTVDCLIYNGAAKIRGNGTAPTVERVRRQTAVLF